MPETVTVDDAPGVATFDVEGMSCASCVAHVKKAAESVPGVEACDVNLAGGSAQVRFGNEADLQRVAQAITESGYPAHVRDEDTDRASGEMARLEKQSHHARAWLRRAGVAIFLWLPLEATHWTLQLLGSHQHHLPAQQNWMGWASLICAT